MRNEDKNKKTFLLFSLVFLLFFSVSVLGIQPQKEEKIDRLDKIPVNIIEKVQGEKLSNFSEGLAEKPTRKPIAEETISRRKWYGNEEVLIKSELGSSINPDKAIFSERYVSVEEYTKYLPTDKFKVRMFVGTDSMTYSIYKYSLANTPYEEVREKGEYYTQVISSNGYVDFEVSGFSVYIAGLPDWSIPANNKAYLLNVTQYVSNADRDSTHIRFTSPDNSSVIDVYHGETKTNSKFIVTNNNNMINITSRNVNFTSGRTMTLFVCDIPFSSCNGTSSDSFNLYIDNPVPTPIVSLASQNLDTTPFVSYTGGDMFNAWTWDTFNVAWSDDILLQTVSLTKNKTDGSNTCSQGSISVCISGNVGSGGVYITIENNAHVFAKNITFTAHNNYYNHDESMKAFFTSSEGSGSGQQNGTDNGILTGRTDLGMTSYFNDTHQTEAGHLVKPNGNRYLINVTVYSAGVRMGCLVRDTSENIIASSFTYNNISSGDRGNVQFNYIPLYGNTTYAIGCREASYIGSQPTIYNSGAVSYPFNNQGGLNITTGWLLDHVYYPNITYGNQSWRILNYTTSNSIPIVALPNRIPLSMFGFLMDYNKIDNRSTSTYYSNYTSIRLTFYNSTSGTNITVNSSINLTSNNTITYVMPEFNLGISAGTSKTIIIQSKNITHSQTMKLEACNDNGCNNTEPYLSLFINGTPPSRIPFDIAPLLMTYSQTQTRNLSLFWSNYESYNYTFQNSNGTNVTITNGQGYNDLYFDIASTLTSISVTSKTTDREFNIYFTMANSAGQNSESNILAVSIKQSQSVITGGQSWFNGIVSGIGSLFPDSSTLSFSTKVLFMFVGFILLNGIIFLGAYLATGEIPPAMLWLAVFLNVILLITFIGLGYVPVAVIVIGILAIIALAWFKIKGSGGG